MTRRLLAAMAAALAVAGCSGVPTSGPIVQGEQIDSENRPNPIRVIVSPPAHGLEPAAVVQGFLEASASAESDHAVARQYLTEAASSRWRAAAVRVLDNGPMGLEPSGTGRVVMTSRQTGSIGEDGSRKIQPAATAYRHEFQLEKVDGEWRIANPPEELLLAESDIERSFRPFAIYFLAPGASRLVPDVRMFPAGASPGPASLMRALLAGPSAWLQPAVTTAVPPDTRLRLDSVPVDGGIASVELSSEAVSASESELRAMAAQIVWTLTRLLNVNGAIVTIGGEPIRLGGGSFVLDRDALSEFDPDAVNTSIPLTTLVEGRPVRPTGSGEEDFARVPRNRWTDLAVGSAGAYAVGVSAGGTQLEKVFSGGLPQPILTSRALATPSIDLSGAIWVTAEGGQRLVRIAADGTSTSGRPDGLPAGARILGSAIARDGTRIALTVAKPGESVVMIGRVVVTDAGTEVQGLRRLETEIADAAEVAWADSDTLALLSGRPGERAVSLLDLETQSVQPFDGPATAAHLAASPRRDLIVSTTEGALWAMKGGQWQAIGAGTHPSYPA